MDWSAAELGVELYIAAVTAQTRALLNRALRTSQQDGAGHQIGDGVARLIVALAFGMGLFAADRILVLAYSVGHHSGGQINCAVTLSLVLGSQVPWYQGLANLLAQLVGSLLGAVLLCAVFPCGNDMTGGTNVINDRFGVGSVLIASDPLQSWGAPTAGGQQADASGTTQTEELEDGGGGGMGAG
ncbi:Aquaporin-1 [Symbiodinium microadriaticum]|uniref:Aquaporin-1 n=1 Tax=Symbiodinium microadriaticum TaxID=2951 RepID=A0A1Q9EH98_SYMMI|nr:Aquaporin-1 [Symbiodinium microadriaticum]